MAIGLSDLSVNKEIKKTPVLKEEVIDSSANQKQQRPWDAKTQSQKSTVASLALKKAAEVSIKNDHQAHELRKNYIASEKELELNQYIENHQDAFLWEIAEEFSVTKQAIFYALKRLKITRKKRQISTKKEMSKRELRSAVT